MDKSRQPGIELAQVIAERVFFEHREDYLSIPPTTGLQQLPIGMKLGFSTNPGGQQGILRLEMSTDPAQNPPYRLEVHIVGLVRVAKGSGNMPLDQYASVSGAALLFPFVRELVANLTGRGRFGPVWLHPINLLAAVGEAGDNTTASVAEPKTRAYRRKPKKRPSKGRR